MKKRILCLLLALMLALLAFSLVSCGDNDDDDDKKGSSKNDELNFDDVLEIFEDIESEETGVDLTVLDGDEAIEMLFGGEAPDDFEVEVKNAFICDGYKEWGVAVFECEDKKDAESFADWISENNFDKIVYKVEGQLLITASSEYMIDVALGEEKYEIDGSSNGGFGDNGQASQTELEYYVSNIENMDTSYMDSQYYVGSETNELAQEMFGYDFMEEFEDTFRNGAWFGGAYESGDVWVIGIFEFEDDTLASSAASWLEMYDEDGNYYAQRGNILVVGSDSDVVGVATGYEEAHSR